MRELSLSSRQLSACRKKIVDGIRDAVKAAKAAGVVVGLSGGIDSSTLAKLASEAVKDVHALMLPEKSVNDPADLRDSIALARKLKIKYSVIEIDNAVASIAGSFPWAGHSPRNRKKAEANIKPRVRMLYGYLMANLDGRLVLGTTNKTELLLGYYTKHGDGACDLEPLASLYKTQVKQLARHIGLPENILKKTPSAGLWRGQTDEAEIGMTYSEMDAILNCLVDKKMSTAQAASETGISPSKVRSIASLMAASEHKRCMPPSIEL